VPGIRHLGSEGTGADEGEGLGAGEDECFMKYENIPHRIYQYIMLLVNYDWRSTITY